MCLYGDVLVWCGSVMWRYGIVIGMYGCFAGRGVGCTGGTRLLRPYCGLGS